MRADFAVDQSNCTQLSDGVLRISNTQTAVSLYYVLTCRTAPAAAVPTVLAQVVPSTASAGGKTGTGDVAVEYFMRESKQ